MSPVEVDLAPTVVCSKCGGPVCASCLGTRVLLNRDGEMVPAPDWTGPVKRQTKANRAVVVRPGEACECLACKPVPAFGVRSDFESSPKEFT